MPEEAATPRREGLLTRDNETGVEVDLGGVGDPIVKDVGLSAEVGPRGERVGVGPFLTPPPPGPRETAHHLILGV